MAPQSVQLLLDVEPGCGFFFPAAQLLQSSERVTPLAEEYRPAMQFTQSFFSFNSVWLLHVPAGHPLQFVLVVSSW
tara:strand:+ start:391 stop:618 length:228 start_codon:yes stop_codon:yes gene_type:complete